MAGLDKIRYGYVNTDYFDFEKNRAYRNDKELQSFRALQSLNEYDAVTNELFLQYELGHPGEDKKKSQVYRLLKSMAIDSHVRRRIADLKKRMKQKG